MIAIAKFFAKRIIDDKTTFNNVPELLSEQVRKVLIELGFGHLAQQEGDQ